MRIKDFSTELAESQDIKFGLEEDLRMALKPFLGMPVSEDTKYALINALNNWHSDRQTRGAGYFRDQPTMEMDPEDPTRMIIKMNYMMMPVRPVSVINVNTIGI